MWSRPQRGYLAMGYQISSAPANGTLDFDVTRPGW
jgi:hypothetical protein